jgi:hypothetical protein
MVYNPQTLRWEGNENTLAQFDLPPVETPTPTAHHRLQHATSYMDIPISDDLDFDDHDVDRKILPTKNHLSIENTNHNLKTNTYNNLKSASPTRPALITKLATSSNTGHNVQVQNGMVYDPQQMKWLKWKGGRDASGQLSPSVTSGGEDDEEDAFAGIDDLRDENAPPLPSGGGLGDVAAAIAGMASPVSLAAAGVGEVHEEFDMGPRFIQLQKDEELAWRRRCSAWFVDDLPRPDHTAGRWRYALRDIVPAHEVLGEENGAASAAETAAEAFEGDLAGVHLGPLLI